MNRLVREAMSTLPRMNEELTEGYIYHKQHLIEREFLAIVEGASESFPPQVVFNRDRSRRATPEEDFVDEVREQRKRSLRETARSDVYRYKLAFDYVHPDGRIEPLKDKFVQLPFFHRGGIFRIRGNASVAAPVLTDTALSVERTQIFIPFTRKRTTFLSTNHSIMVNGWLKQAPVVYSRLHNKTSKSVRRLTVLMHYMLGWHGVERAFKQFFDADIIPIEGPVDRNQYPEDEYVHYESTGLNPFGRGMYVSTRISFLVPVEQTSHRLDKAMGGLFYVLDRAADTVTLEELNNPRLWRRDLVNYLDLNIATPDKVNTEMDNHFETVESYMDILVKQKLRDAQIPYESAAHLFEFLISHFSRLTATSQPNDVSDKHLEAVRPLLFGLTKCISTMMWQLITNADKPKGVTVSNANDTIASKIYTDAITKSVMLGLVSQLDSATDCLPYGVTRTLVPQSMSTSTSDSIGASVPRLLHWSMLPVSSYLAVTKSRPEPIGTINHFAKLDRKGYVKLTEEQKKRYGYAQSRLDF